MSKPEAPTLADALIREWLKPDYRRIEREQGWLARKVSAAHRFVLDDAMSAFLGDLAYASLMTCGDPEKPDKAILLTDSMRMSARLPHALTFIEYNMEAKKARVRAQYGNDPRFQLWSDHVKGPTKCGWLIEQHAIIPTAFRAMEVASHSFGRDQSELMAVPQPNALGYAWTTDDSVPPWPAMPWKQRSLRTASGEVITPTPCGMLTGILQYDTPSLHLVYPPHLKPALVDAYVRNASFNPLDELASDARYLWGLLATINDLPTITQQVRPSKGYIARGQYRKFVEHTLVTLTVPQKIWQRLATRAIAIARRRQHPVRGHWRKDWRLPLSPLCEHEFNSDDTAMVCKRCHGRRMWVTEHTRGDATLGVVTHMDYSIRKSDGEGNKIPQ